MNKKMMGRKLNSVRKSKGLTGEKLSELCHINATYLRQIESGAKTPSLPVFLTLCQVLQVSPSYILSDSMLESQIGEMDQLWELWSKATPQQSQIISAMIRAALENI